jgi:hypothetical protein
MPVWKTLRRNMPKVTPSSPNRIDYGAKIDRLDLNYMAGMKTLTFTGLVHSHERPATYSMILVFKNVTAYENLTEEEIEQGFQPKPSLSNNELQVRCSCPSYRFRFDRANRDHHAGTGARFPTYIRKTNRRPNNPRNLPSFCPHVQEFINYLLERGFIVD